MEDDIEFTCPNCSASLGLDEVGDLELKAYPQSKPGQHVGIGGLQTIEASPSWKQEAYFWGQANGGERAQTQMQEPSNAGAQPKKKRTKKAAVRMTPELQTALDDDLSKRQIKLKSTETND